MNKKNNILVSIIVVNYNNAKFINRCLKSTLNQTYDYIEIIFVDDSGVGHLVGSKPIVFHGFNQAHGLLKRNTIFVDSSR